MLLSIADFRARDCLLFRSQFPGNIVLIDHGVVTAQGAVAGVAIHVRSLLLAESANNTVSAFQRRSSDHLLRSGHAVAVAIWPDH